MVKRETKACKECIECKKSHHGINGLFCNILKRYVEYEREPKCR